MLSCCNSQIVSRKAKIFPVKAPSNSSGARGGRGYSPHHNKVLRTSIFALFDIEFGDTLGEDFLFFGLHYNCDAKTVPILGEDLYFWSQNSGNQLFFIYLLLK